MEVRSSSTKVSLSTLGYLFPESLDLKAMWKHICRRLVHSVDCANNGLTWIRPRCSALYFAAADNTRMKRPWSCADRRKIGLSWNVSLAPIWKRHCSLKERVRIVDWQSLVMCCDHNPLSAVELGGTFIILAVVQVFRFFFFVCVCILVDGCSCDENVAKLAYINKVPNSRKLMWERY